MMHGKARAFTRKATREYETLVKCCAKSVLSMYELNGNRWNNNRSYEIFVEVGADKAVVTVVSRPIRKRSVRSDLDNIAKSILDAMNGIVYQDDSQVVKIEIKDVGVADGKTKPSHRKKSVRCATST